MDEITCSGGKPPTEEKPMFWAALNKGQREIIETGDGSPPPDQDLIILGGFATHEQAAIKMNENQQQQPAAWG